VSSRGPLDQQPGEPGWWLASDGRWYPPESAPTAPAWAAPGAPYGSAGRKRRRWVLPVVVIAVLAFGGCGAVIFVVARNPSVRQTVTAVQHGADRFYTSESESMVPTIGLGDRFAATTKIGTIERGDVLAVRSPRPGVTLIVKRVVALPGETIAARDGHLFVNGAQLNESYLDSATVTPDFPPVVVGPDSYFLMGDNRDNSLDSRSFGAVNRSTVVAVVLRIITPSSRAGALPGSPRS
jgi:signal peptidase I